MQNKISLILIISLLLGAFTASAAPRNNKGGGSDIAAPSNLVSEAVSSSQINLSWQDNSDNEIGFKVERSLDGNNFLEIAELGENATSYSDIGLAQETTYYYEVRAFKQQGSKVKYSDYSNVDSATTFSVPPVGYPPADPTNLTAAASSTEGVMLYWSDNSDNEDEFKIERSQNGVDFTEIASRPAGYNYYFDSSATSGQTYYYRVRAMNEYGYSGYSNVASVVIP